MIQDAQDGGQALIANDRDQILRTTVDEAPQGIANAWEGVVVEPHHDVSEGDQHEKVEELRHTETWAALGGCKCLLDAEPHQHDGGESDADVEPKCINRRGCRGS